MKNARAHELISLLNLEPHPEGGYYREIFRSAIRVGLYDQSVTNETAASAEKSSSEPRARATIHATRSALTQIYYLLPEGQFSRWHQVDSDEIWHYYEGEPLELIWFFTGEQQYRKQTLGPLSSLATPLHVIPSQAWQAAHSLGSYTLVGCTVAPGFEFSDFRLLSESKDEAHELRRNWPELERFL